MSGGKKKKKSDENLLVNSPFTVGGGDGDCERSLKTGQSNYSRGFTLQ